MEIIETIPNFSEGRNEETIRLIAEAFKSVPGVKLLDYSMDPDHNRSVFTAKGPGEAILKALEGAAAVAAGRIDLRTQKGLHPRVGAMDVVPFVPLQGAEMTRAVSLSRTFAEDIFRDLSIPCYYYEESALRPERRNLADIRRGGFEALPARMKTPEWAPDVGSPAPHVSAGATVTGARGPLIAYNIFLNTRDKSVADSIASKIREKNGGLPGIKALGLYLSSRDMAQVSINICDYTKTSPFKVFDTVRNMAAEYGTSVACSELIGLAPEAAFSDCRIEELMIENLTDMKIIERNNGI